MDSIPRPLDFKSLPLHHKLSHATSSKQNLNNNNQIKTCLFDWRKTRLAKIKYNPPFLTTYRCTKQIEGTKETRRPNAELGSRLILGSIEDKIKLVPRVFLIPALHRTPPRFIGWEEERHWEQVWQARLAMLPSIVARVRFQTRPYVA